MNENDSRLPGFLQRIIKRDRYYPVIAYWLIVLFFAYDGFNLKDGRPVIDDLESVFVTALFLVLGLVMLIAKKRYEARMRELMRQERMGRTSGSRPPVKVP